MGFNSGFKELNIIKVNFVLNCKVRSTEGDLNTDLQVYININIIDADCVYNHRIYVAQDKAPST